jgi:membrane protein
MPRARTPERSEGSVCLLLGECQVTTTVRPHLEPRPRAFRPSSAARLLVATVDAWLDDRGPSMAASLAFYTILSVAPLLVVAVSVAGLVLGQSAARGEIAQQLRHLMGNDAGAAIESILAHSKEPSANILGTIIGLAVLLFGASGVFTELQDSMNAIWKVKPPPGRALFAIVKSRFLSFAMVLGVAFLLLVSLVISAALAVVGRYLSGALPGGVTLWMVLNFLISFAVVTLLFSLIFKVVPDASVRWRDVWRGGAFTALLFTIGKTLIGLYVGKAGVASPYGAAGSLVVLIVWVYYSAQILFLGAEFTRVYALRERGQHQGEKA